MPDDEPPKNPFVRFKRHVDSSIGHTIDGVLALPSTISRPKPSPTPSLDQAEQQQQQPPSSQQGQPPEKTGTKMELPDSPTKEVMDWPTARLWQRFVYYSPYSPLNLRHIPQPIPNDLPADVHPNTFTYEDAFEDLLSEAAGRPMMDLGRRSEARQLLQEMFPQGEPGFFWLRRLQSQGLLQNDYHAALDRPRVEWERPRTMEEWVERRRQELVRDWEGTEDASSREAGHNPSWSDWLDRDITINFGDMARKADRAFKDLAHAINEASQKDSPSAGAAEDMAPSQTSGKQPETEGDLFSVISSALADADKSLNTFFKSFTGASVKTDFSTSFEKQEKYSSGEGDDIDPGRTVKSTEEHIDRFGNLHTKTEIKRLNADGQEIGRETHYSIRPVPQNTEDSEAHNNEAEPVSKDVEGQKASGWFWK